jgi:hypothetical protein
VKANRKIVRTYKAVSYCQEATNAITSIIIATPKGKGKGSTAATRAPKSTTGGKGKGKGSSAPSVSVDVEASADEMPSKSSLCEFHNYKFIVTDINITETSVGETFDITIYSNETGMVVAHYQHASTFHDSGDADYIGVFGYDWKDDAFQSQIFLQGLYTGEFDVITGGTGKFECVKGTLTGEYPDNDEYGYLTLKVCGAGCSLYK